MLNDSFDFRSFYSSYYNQTFSGFLDHFIHTVAPGSHALVGKNMHNVANPNDQVVDGAGPIFERDANGGFYSDSSLGLPNSWVPIRSEWRNIDRSGTAGLIGSMTTDGTEVVNGQWGGHQYFYYTDVDDGDKEPDSADPPRRWLYRRKIQSFLAGMGPRQPLKDLGPMNRASSDTSDWQPAPYVLVNYSWSKQKFVVLYYCHASNGNDDICLQTTSDPLLRDITIGFDADHASYSLNLVNDSNIPRNPTTGRFVVGQFGLRLCGYGMHVANGVQGSGDVVVYFPSAPVGTPHWEAATWGHTTYAKQIWLQ